MKATKSMIENKAFANHKKDRALEPKHQTPDNYWSDWFEKGYREAETEAEERHAKELHELRDRAADSYKAVCRTLFFGCDLESCDPSKCSGLLSFTQKLNEQ